MLKPLRSFLFVVVLIFSLLAITPLCLIRPFHPVNSTYFYAVFYHLMAFAFGIRIKIEGQEHLAKNCPGVIITNHQHNFDVFAVAKLFFGRVAILGKKELLYVPIFGQIFWLEKSNLSTKLGNRMN